MLSIQAEAYKNQTFHCTRCKSAFHSTVATWVDVSRAPKVKALLNRWEFNMVSCPHCGNRQFSGSFFFYEDFAEGLLIAVFPEIPANRPSLEEEIKKRYGYYPVLDFFYDMTQLWFFIYLQEHYKSRSAGSACGAAAGEPRIRKFLWFVKKDPLMLTIRETLAGILSGNKTSEDLQDVLWQALAKIDATQNARQRRPRRRENETISF